MRKLIFILLIVAAISPFVAIFLGPLLTGDATASLYFFPSLVYALMCAMPLTLALLIAPAGKRGIDESAWPHAIRQACSAALVVMGLLSPWWWPVIGQFTRAVGNRGDLPLLQEVCKAKAKDNTLHPVLGVHDLSIRLPRSRGQRDSQRDPWEIETPLHSRDIVESTWEALFLGPARFDHVVVEESVANGGIEWHGLAQDVDGVLGHLDVGTAHPRYELSWDYIQTPSEQISGLVGVRTQITDTVSDEILASRTTYFLRQDHVTIYDSHVNPMYDACENAIYRRNGSKIQFINNSFDWVRRVLRP